MNASIRRIENVHIAFWLLKDIGWIHDLYLLGVAMVIPTLAIALWLTWHTRHDRAERCHSTAVVCWIVANAIWMVGEFFFNDSTRHYASAFFALGIAVLAWHYTTALIGKCIKGNQLWTK